MSNEIQKLTEIKSLHEQREMFGNPDIIVKPGVWIEILDFDPDTEKVTIKHRWEVESVSQGCEQSGVIKYRVVCNNLNVKEIDANKERLAKLVIEKHKEKLKSSFVKCLIDGISTKTIDELKGMLSKLEE